MEKKLVFLSFVFISIIISQSVFAVATTYVIANHETRECSTQFSGDEYTVCHIPTGWVNIGYANPNLDNYGCPEDYTYIEDVEGCISIDRFIFLESLPLIIAVIVIFVVAIIYLVKRKK